MVYDCNGVTLTQGEFDIVTAYLAERASVRNALAGRGDIAAIDADSALQKFLDVERRALRVAP